MAFLISRCKLLHVIDDIATDQLFYIKVTAGNLLSFHLHASVHVKRLSDKLIQCSTGMKHLIYLS